MCFRGQGQLLVTVTFHSGFPCISLPLRTVAMLMLSKVQSHNPAIFMNIHECIYLTRLWFMSCAIYECYYEPLTTDVMFLACVVCAHYTRRKLGAWGATGVQSLKSHLQLASHNTRYKLLVCVLCTGRKLRSATSLY